MPSLLRSLRFWIWTLAIALALVIALILLVPVVGRKLIISKGTEILGKQVQLEEFSFDPLRCAVTLNGFRILNADGTPMVLWTQMHADFEVASLWGDYWHLKEFRLIGLRGDVLIRKDGTINLLDLIPANAADDKAKVPAELPKVAAEKEKPTKGVLISHLEIKDASAHVKDLARKLPFEREIGPISIVLDEVGTVPGKDGNGSMKLEIGGIESMAWSGKIQGSPFKSSGHVSLKGIDAVRYTAYYHEMIPAVLSSAVAEINFDYTLDPASEAIIRVENCDLLVSKIALQDPATKETFLGLASLEVKGLQANYAAQKIAIPEVALKGFDLSARRLKDGSIDLLKLLLPPSDGIAPVAGAHESQLPLTVKPQKPWELSLAKLSLGDSHIKLTDESVSPAAHVNVDSLQVAVTGINYPQLGTVGLDLGFLFQKTGQVALKGEVDLKNLGAKLHLQNKVLPLGGFEGYLTPFVKLRNLDALLSMEGDVTFAMGKEAEAPAITWKGSVFVDKFDFTGIKPDTTAYSDPYLRFGRLAIEGIQADTASMKVEIERIGLTEAKVRTTILPGYAIDWQKLIVPASNMAGTVSAKSAESQAQAPAKALPAPSIRIGKVELDNLLLRADDYTGGLRFNPTFNIMIGGSIAGLSTEQLAHAEVNLKGTLSDAPISITGQINPLSKSVYSQLKLSCGGFELPAVSPYAERYIGYQIAQGKLIMNVSGKLSEDLLEADNHIVFDQFYLGQEVSSPDAIKAPVKLGLALLRDRHGRIDISIPVRGNLKDPDFRYGKFVWQTIGNLMTKAATAPFAMLGSLFGDGADLSQLEFDSGASELTKDSLKRLDGLAKALTERPGLSLEVLPQGLQYLDEAGIRQKLFSDKIRELRLEELRKVKPDAVLEKNETIAAIDEERLIRAWHAELQKQALAQAKSGEPAPAAAKITVVPPKPKLMRKVWNVVTLKPWLKRDQVSKAQAKKDTSAAANSTVQKAGPVVLTVAEMKTELLANLGVSAEAYRRLTHRRALRIKSYLETDKKIDTTRIFLLENDPSESMAKGEKPVVTFRLK